MKMKADMPPPGEEKASRPFRLRRATFKGQGLTAELRDADWAEIRDLAYERGGER
jgi:hypothetical protein